MSPAESAVHKKLRAIREDYTRHLTDKIQAIEEVWVNLIEHQWDQQGLATLHRHTHGLAGSGSTFGYEEVSNTARVLDTEVKALMDILQIPDATIIDGIKSKLNLLKQACTDAVSTLDHESDHNIDTIFSLPVHPNPNTSNLVLIFEEVKGSCEQIVSQIQQYNYDAMTKVIDESTSKDEIDKLLEQQTPDVLIFNARNYIGKIKDITTEINLVHAHDVPSIFISSNGHMEQRLNAVRCGSDAYFVEPVDTSTLIDKLDQFCSADEIEPYRVLIVDDSESLANAYAMFLEQSAIQTLVITDPLKACDTLYEYKPDLILLDMYMPECSGPELASVIRQQETYASIPIVFLSAEVDVNKQLTAMSLGGDDFLTKPIKPQHLINSVKIRAERYRQLRGLMVRDSLTGLYNHSKTEEQLQIELSRAERNLHELAYVMVDLDHFKSINDNHGHAAGDMVLKSTARLLHKSLRKTDIVGRYGGEEFAVILYGTSKEQAFDVMENIRNDLQEINHTFDNQRLSVTCSCGIALYPQFKTYSDLHQAADKALYEAKKQRNKVVVAQ